MSQYLRDADPRRTPLTEPLTPEQVQNDDGAYVFAADDWKRMERFLILGSEGGSYYAGEAKLTRENAQAVDRCIREDGERAVNLIVLISQEGRAPKNDPAIYALALAASAAEPRTRMTALANLNAVCRTGTHLFHFAAYVEQFRGWGRALRRAIGGWYLYPPVDEVAYQCVKYRQRDGWSHRDLLRLSHPDAKQAWTEDGPMRDALFAWITGKEIKASLPEIVGAYERAQSSLSPHETAGLIREYGNRLPREALNPDHLTSPDVWEALLNEGMPMTALIRNLATMTRVGLLAPMSVGTRKVVEQLGDVERIRKARVHPLAVLVAHSTYASGRSARGVGEWNAVPEIIDALDAAFYTAFGNVEPMGKRTMLALDVSGSMDWAQIAGMPGITPRVGSAAMALVTAATEPAGHVAITAFSHGMVPVQISPRQRLVDALIEIDSLPMGATDCSLPMRHALTTGMDVDTFIIYTDNETNRGDHPAESLRLYRQRTGIDAKLIVVGMISNGFSIADPNDPGMLDVVGMDLATPQVMSEFARA